jgi:hypothetical protein
MYIFNFFKLDGSTMHTNKHVLSFVVQSVSKLAALPEMEEHFTVMINSLNKAKTILKCGNETLTVGQAI